MTAALETQGLGLDFGGVRAADGVSLSLAPGARAALIGPNGAGKTTLVNLLSGALRPARGRILMGGRDVTRAGPAARAQAGLSRSFQVAQLFPTLTPAESVALASRARRGRQDAAARAAETEALLGQFALTEVADRPAGQLGYGQQRLVESIFLRRTGTVADISNTVLFLASDLASWITGQTLVVDGGQRLA